MKTLSGVGRTPAPRAAVWALLEDASAWSRWGSWKESSVEGGAPHVLGAIRILVQPPFRVRERVTEWEPGARMGYELIEGMKVRGYRSVVELEDAPDGGTVIRWTSTYEKAGPLTAILLRMAVRDAPKRLAKAASR